MRKINAVKDLRRFDSTAQKSRTPPKEGCFKDAQVFSRDCLTKNQVSNMGNLGKLAE
jgi:hypothetical protein